MFAVFCLWLELPRFPVMLNDDTASISLETGNSKQSGSANRRMALTPARFQHRLPSLDCIVPKHSPACLWDWVIRWPPMKRPQDHPLPMDRWNVWFELHDLLLIGVGQPAFALRLLRLWMCCVIFDRHGFKSGLHPVRAW